MRNVWELLLFIALSKVSSHYDRFSMVYDQVGCGQNFFKRIYLRPGEPLFLTCGSRIVSLDKSSIPGEFIWKVNGSKMEYIEPLTFVHLSESPILLQPTKKFGHLLWYVRNSKHWTGTYMCTDLGVNRTYSYEVIWAEPQDSIKPVELSCSVGQDGIPRAYFSWRSSSSNDYHTPGVIEQMTKPKDASTEVNTNPSFKHVASSSHWVRIIPEAVLPNSANDLRHNQFRAITPIHGNMEYDFRIHPRDEPAEHLRHAMQAVSCRVRPTVPQTLPSSIRIYGTDPGTLFVEWKPIPFDEHGGPGFEYHVTITCLNCDRNPSSSQFVVKSNATTRLEFQTRIGDMTNLYAQYPIGYMRKYEVILTTRNHIGPGNTLPLISYGYSGEIDHDLVVVDLTITRSSNMVKIHWSCNQIKNISQRSWFLRGFRIYYCAINEALNKCDMTNANQLDYLLQTPSDEIFAEQRDKVRNQQVDPFKSLYHRDNYMYMAWIVNLTESTKYKATIQTLSTHRAGLTRQFRFETLEALPELTIENLNATEISIRWSNAGWSPLGFHQIEVVRADRMTHTIAEVIEVNGVHRLIKPHVVVENLEPCMDYLITTTAFVKPTGKRATTVRILTRGCKEEVKISTPQGLSAICQSNAQTVGVVHLQWKVSGYHRFAPQLEWIAEPRSIDGNSRGKLQLDSTRQDAQEDTSSDKWFVVQKDNTLMINCKRLTRHDVYCQAVLPINSDIIYRFRVRTRKGDAISEPSDITPQNDDLYGGICYVPSQPVTVLPRMFRIITASPKKLLVGWENLPETLHNGPGLKYILRIQCATCADPFSTLEQYEFPKSVNEVLFTGVNVDGARHHQNAVVNYSISGHQLYELELSVHNVFRGCLPGYLKLSVTSNLRTPSIRPEIPQLIDITSNVAILTWPRLKQYVLERHMHGELIGFRVKLCFPETEAEMCPRPDIYQDYSIGEYAGGDIIFQQLTEEVKGDGNLLLERNRGKQNNRTEDMELMVTDEKYCARLQNLPPNMSIAVKISALNSGAAGPDRTFFFKTLHVIPDFKVSRTLNNAALLTWDNSTDGAFVTTEYHLKLMKVFRIENVLQYKIQESVINHATSGAAWLVGLDFKEASWSVSLRTRQQGAWTRGSTLQIPPGPVSTKSTPLPISVVPIARKLNSVHVCLNENIIKWTEEIQSSSWRRDFLELNAKLRNLESDVWTTYHEIIHQNCILIDNLRPSMFYQVFMVLDGKSSNPWTFEPIQFNLLELQNFGRQQYEQMISLMKPGNKIFYRIISTCILLGFLGISIISVSEWIIRGVCVSRRMRRFLELQRHRHQYEEPMSATFLIETSSESQEISGDDLSKYQIL